MRPVKHYCNNFFFRLKIFYGADQLTDRQAIEINY